MKRTCYSVVRPKSGAAIGSRGLREANRTVKSAKRLKVEYIRSMRRLKEGQLD